MITSQYDSCNKTHFDFYPIKSFLTCSLPVRTTQLDDSSGSTHAMGQQADLLRPPLCGL